MHKLVKLTGLRWYCTIFAIFLCACSGKNVKETDDYGFEDAEDEAPTQFEEPVVQAPAATAPPERPPVRVALREDVPSSYTVKKGDTLWDISSLFLRDPWLWPEIWYFNPQIDNPHLIYPGDILTLVYVDGKPQLRLSRDDGVTRVIQPSVPGGIKTIKLSPKIREESLAKAIPTIPVSAIEPFLIQPRIVTKEELEAAPYIISSLDQHLVSATGNTVYARNLENAEDVRYNIFRPGRVFRDPKTNRVLGYETTLVSEAKLVNAGDPATMILTRSIRETLNGDRILPAEKGRISYNFLPKAPETTINGQIIALVDAISHSAQRQVVVLNLGEQQGVEVGTVLAIDQAGAEVRDPFARKGFNKVKLPDARAGLLMIFRVFDKVSYGLIMDSTRTVHVNDIVRNPTPAPILSD